MLIEASREFVPGVWITGGMLEEVPPGDPAYFKVRYEMKQAFDWKMSEPLCWFIPAKPYKVPRPQKRRMWHVTWTEGGYDEIVPQDLPVLASLAVELPVAMPAPEIRHVESVCMVWSGWQYELELAPEGFAELAWEKGWLPTGATTTGEAGDG